MNPRSFFFEDLLSSEDVHPLEGGRLRILTGKAALRQLWHHQTQLGITRLSDLTDLDVLGIPVFDAVRPTVDRAQITATQGKGLTKIDAVMSALFEALERTAAARERPRIKASRNELIRGQRPFIDIFTNSGHLSPRIYVKPGLNPIVVGISMKWWSQSLDGKCTCGVLSTAKVRLSRSWSSPNATKPRR